MLNSILSILRGVVGFDVGESALHPAHRNRLVLHCACKAAGAALILRYSIQQFARFESVGPAEVSRQCPIGLLGLDDITAAS